MHTSMLSTGLTSEHALRLCIQVCRAAGTAVLSPLLLAFIRAQRPCAKSSSVWASQHLMGRMTLIALVMPRACVQTA